MICSMPVIFESPGIRVTQFFQNLPIEISRLAAMRRGSPVPTP
jgi:hypothetical protein